ncbi:anti-sigma factor [Nocardioides gansuensis]|uniref:Anti-sigma factor n=1 Tax=Nocardioides gansuensis TaxID=2138300 RepID=A0A2T8FCI1_9ACTN|nr:zf-HC2 domain-containing protein [Nocardioides gansuensis]PVG83417.1 anti-sigma factor [Nocardioides gansuensis]
MTCPHARDAGAYVLGALAPTERLAFERHLSECDDCARSVRELAGLPGLLGRVDASLLEHAMAGQPPVPATLLPALCREVRRARRRRTLVAAGLGAAAAALVAAVVLPLAGLPPGDEDAGPTASPSSTAPSSPSSTATPRAMRPIGEVPVRALVTLEQVTWGTRLALECTYDPGSVEYGLPEAVDYLLVVRTRDGRTERVGSWRSVGGRTMRLAAATAADTDEIASVEVRTPDGRVVLKLPA